MIWDAIVLIMTVKWPIIINNVQWLSTEGSLDIMTFSKNTSSHIEPIASPAAADAETTMMASSNGNIFRVTGPLWGESSCDRWIPLTKAGDTELWCFLWSAPEQTVKKTIKTPVIWDAVMVQG